MAMNRETKRMLQRQGELGPDGEPARTRQDRPSARPPSQKRVGPRQYGREVKGELRKVAWPDREEVVRYSIIVLVTLVILTAFIFALDWLFSEAVFFIFDAPESS